MKQIFLYLSSLSLALITTGYSGDGKHVMASHGQHQTHDHSGHDGHSHTPAPIGVMGAHTHKKGETMFSYRFMYMDMGPNYMGSDQVGLSQIQGMPNGDDRFPIIPTEMQTQMQSLGVMHGLTDKLTLMGMLMYVDKAMQHSVVNGTTFRTHTSGIGDFKFGGLLNIFETEHNQVHLNLMASAPTGSLDNAGFVPPAGASIRLPYPMQLGSGTWDLMPGITWIGQRGDFSYGSQAMATLRLDENDQGYTLGDGFMLTGWVAYQLTDALSTSFRTAYKTWDDVDGSDPQLNPLLVPTARADLRGGERIDMFGGLNYEIQNGVLKGHRLSVEAGGAVYQDLDGPQLGMDWSVITGWQKAF